MVYLRSPAVQFRLPPENTIHMVGNHCHQACYDYIRAAYEIYAQIFPDKYDVIEGYTLTDGSFVNREDAYDIAKHTEALEPMYYGMRSLQSYMVKHYGGPFEND